MNNRGNNEGQSEKKPFESDVPIQTLQTYDLSKTCNELYSIANDFLSKIITTNKRPDFKVNGVDIYYMNDNGRKIEIKKDNVNDITTIIIPGNEEDKKNGLMGTDGRAVVKLLGENSYDNIKTEDFIARGQLLFAAARDIINKGNLHGSEKEARLAWVEEQENRYMADIYKYNNLDVTLMKQNSSNKYYFDNLAQVKYRLQQNIVNIAHSLSTPDENSEQIINKLKEAEKAHIKQRGRPIIIKTKKVNILGLGEIETVSTQIPLGKKTLPSSMRSGKDDDEIKLSNHVRDGSGVIVNGKIEIKTVVDGHSSYPAIDESSH